MNGETAEFLLKIYSDHVLTLKLCGIGENGKASAFQISNGQGNVIGAHSDMTVNTSSHVLVDLHTGGCENRGVANLYREIKCLVQLVCHIQCGVRIRHVNAYMGQLISEIGIVDYIHSMNLLNSGIRGIL